MTDPLDPRGASDRARISLEQTHERRYWAEALGVGEQRLREAVAAVGNDAGKVRRYLQDERSASARGDHRAQRDAPAAPGAATAAESPHQNDRPVDQDDLRTF